MLSVFFDAQRNVHLLLSRYPFEVEYMISISLCSFNGSRFFCFLLLAYHKAASLADSTPASLPLPLRVEPKPKSGIRQQDLLKNIVEIKPKRQRISSPSGPTQGDRSSPYLSPRVSLSGNDEQILEKCLPPAERPTDNISSSSAYPVSTQRDTEDQLGEDSSSRKPNGKDTDAKPDNAVTSLLGLAYESSDDE